MKRTMSTGGDDRPRYPGGRGSTLPTRVWLTSRLFRSTGAWTILVLATAPLLDGVFVSAVGGGELSASSVSGVFAAIAFGLVAFSGGGCIAGAFNLEGTRTQQLAVVAVVYLVVAAGITTTLLGLARFDVRIAPEFRCLAALVLVALALTMVSVDIVPKSPPLAIVVVCGAWWGLSETLTPHLPSSDVSPFDATPVALGSLIALATGFTATLAAVLFRPFLERVLDPWWLDRAGAAAIALIALVELGVPVPGPAIIGTFLAITTIGVVWRVRRVAGPEGAAA